MQFCNNKNYVIIIIIEYIYALSLIEYILYVKITRELFLSIKKKVGKKSEAKQTRMVHVQISVPNESDGNQTEKNWKKEEIKVF